MLFLAALVVLLSLELGARYLVPLVNWNMRRFEKECADAISMGQGHNAAKPGILMLGNSLTWNDIDMDVLRQHLGATNEVCRWAVDDTNYLDWYYGLRRAIRHGARPKYVVIGGRSDHFLAEYVRGCFFAHYILDWRDLRELAARVGANPTALSNMVLAQVSAFYGSREEIFKRCLTAVVPSFPQLGRRMTWKGRKAPTPVLHSSTLLVGRLEDLRARCSECGAKLVLWIPPTPYEDKNAAWVAQAAAEENIPLILPLAPSPGAAWTERDFSDGYHMTTDAAKRLTGLLSERLELLLPEDSVASKSSLRHVTRAF